MCNNNVYKLVSVSMIFISGFFILKNYNSLSERIPVNYDYLGRIDNYGDKSDLIIIFIVQLVTFITLFILTKFPHKLNYPIIIPKERKIEVYKLAIRTILLMAMILNIAYTLTICKMSEMYNIPSCILIILYISAIFPMFNFLKKVMR